MKETPKKDFEGGGSGDDHDAQRDDGGNSDGDDDDGDDANDDDGDDGGDDDGFRWIEEDIKG